jgi:hypothetical protein
MPHTREQFNGFTPCQPCAVVYLNFKPNSTTQIIELDKAIGMSTMMLNAFNYSVVGKPAFDALVDLSNLVRFFEITYSNMQDVNDFLAEFVEG